MATDSHGMGIELPADSTPVHQFPGVTRLAMERVAEILAGDLPGGVTDAISAQVGPAVDAELDAAAADGRLPAMEDETEFRVRNKDGGVPLRVAGDSVFLGPNEVAPTSDERFTLKSSSGHWLFDVDPVTGAVYAPNLYADTLTVGGAPGSGPAPRVVLNIMAGQSNGEGRAKPYGPELDPADTRIAMWDWSSKTLKTATVPLSSQQQQIGLSVATVISRATIATEPPGTQVVVFNAAAGGSGMVAQPAQGTWKIDYAGPNPKLYSIMTGQLDLLLPAIQAKYGVAPIIRFYWHQGEADTDAAAYATAFDAMVADLRTRLALPDMPVILGGIVPEGTPGSTITPVHIQTPARLTRAAYAPGIPNGGGSASTADVVHYHRAGAERLGNAMYEAHRRALSNTAASVPVPPLDVSATFIAGTLTAKWSAPLCRVTDYTVEYSIDGGAWAAITGRPAPIDTTATKTGLAGAVARVRVATVNPVGTSAATTPVTALGA